MKTTLKVATTTRTNIFGNHEQKITKLVKIGNDYAIIVSNLLNGMIVSDYTPVSWSTKYRNAANAFKNIAK